MKIEDGAVYRLCYVQGCWAYFTTCQLDKQWGDDWNDAPYEHNAGAPYEWHSERDGPRYEIRRLAFDGPYVTPDDGQCNSPWSVEQINRGEVAWLRDRWHGKGRPIMAGDTIEDFKNKMQEAGGSVWEECTKLEAILALARQHCHPGCNPGSHGLASKILQIAGERNP